MNDEPNVLKSASDSFVRSDVFILRILELPDVLRIVLTILSLRV